MRIKNAFKNRNIDFLVESYTNQQFPILTKDQQNKLISMDISFNVECGIDESRDAVRFCTNWATTEEAVSYLENAIGEL